MSCFMLWLASLQLFSFDDGSGYFNIFYELSKEPHLICFPHIKLNSTKVVVIIICKHKSNSQILNIFYCIHKEIKFTTSHFINKTTQTNIFC